MGRIVTDNRLPLALYQDLKLNRKPGNPSSVDPVLRAYPGIEIQLAFIRYISQGWRFSPAQQRADSRLILPLVDWVSNVPGKSKLARIRSRSSRSFIMSGKMILTLQFPQQAGLTPEKWEQLYPGGHLKTGQLWPGQNQPAAGRFLVNHFLYF